MTTKITDHKWFRPVLFLAAGLLLGWLLFGGQSHSEPDDHEGHDHAQAEAGTEVWTCSMHPSVRSDEPGSCPICGMDLIPASSELAEGEFTMVMTQEAIKLAEIQTVPVTREAPEIEFNATGRITPDERSLSNITGNFHGRITELYVQVTGERVEKGQKLFSIYSDDLITAQRELIEAAKNKNTNPGLYRAAIQKLRYWDIHDAQIEAIENREEPLQQVDILSPASGVVMERNVSENDHVYQGDVLFELAELDPVWVQLDLFESDLAMLDVGDQVEFRVRAFPGETFDGVVTFIDPFVNENRRTARARIEVDNPGLKLKPDMLVSGKIKASSSEEQLLVPRSAVLWTGQRSLVYVQLNQEETPSFESREITLGPRAGDYYIVRDGLAEDEHVVFNGAFKIDSEFQLADKFSMMNREPGTGAVPAGHQHGEVGDRLNEEDHSDHSVAADDFSSETDEDFKEDFETLINAYLAVKDELFQSNPDEAVRLSQEMMATLEEIGEHRLSGDAHTAWMEYYHNFHGHLEPMTEAADIDSFREDFRYLSYQMIEAVKAFGIDGVYYHQYCPMAFNDEGAYWLNDEEQIQNPYMSETMPGCGEVIERIE